MSTFIHDLHVQAQAVVVGLDTATLDCDDVKVVRKLGEVRRDAQRMLDLTGQQGGLEQEYAGPDLEGLLFGLVAAVMERGGRLEHPATADSAGVNRAMAALAEMKPILGRTPDDRGHLLEAVRAQDATVTLELYGGARSGRVSKTIENYPVPRIPVVGDEFLLDDGSLARVVVPVRLVGRAAIVRAQVWATLPDSEKF